MDFKSIIKKALEVLDKAVGKIEVTLPGIKDAAKAVDRWDDPILNELSEKFPDNPGIIALKEIEPRIVRGIIGAIEAAENTDLKGVGKLGFATGIVLKSEELNDTIVGETSNKIQFVFDILKGVKKLI